MYNIGCYLGCQGCKSQVATIGLYLGFEMDELDDYEERVPQASEKHAGQRIVSNSRVIS